MCGNSKPVSPSAFPFPFEFQVRKLTFCTVSLANSRQPFGPSPMRLECETTGESLR